MTKPGVSTKTTQRIDRLLRSLVGVADVHMTWGAHNLRAVHILRSSGTQPHQLMRNIVSGLHAGFSIQLLPTQVHIHDNSAVFDAIQSAADVLSDPAMEEDDAGDATVDSAPPAATPGVIQTDGSPLPLAPSNGHGRRGPASESGTVLPHFGGDAVKSNGHAGSTAGRDPSSHDGIVRRGPRNGGGDLAGARPSRVPPEVLAAAAELVMRNRSNGVHGLILERIDVDRRGGMLRCRTVLALGDQLYSAIAEVPDSPSAEAELAARVAVDALRAGGVTTAMLDGVGFITIAKTNYCVATVREPGSVTPRASAAPLIDSMAASATAAVLTALGTFTDARAQNRARAGH